MKTRTLDITLNNKLIKKDFEVPEDWSDRAALICATKYATDTENSAIDIIDRVVSQITEWGIEQGYFNLNANPDSIPASDEFADSLKDILINQRAAFNSPVWFNCGVEKNSNQMSACFIFPIEDNLEDIAAHLTRETTVFKSGSGSGVNISSLRAKGEPLSNKGTSSGPVSFMRTLDKNAGSVKSGGKTRRAAKLVCMDVDHPDIEEFIECKKKEEDKAKILIANGVNQEEAYSTVDFQNTNHSIRVTDEFMRAVENNEEWLLRRRTDGKTHCRVNAKDLLMKAAQIAWETGDPGIQFDDRMNLDNPVPSLNKIRSTNPCSEFSAVDNSSCNLASLNLLKYYDAKQNDFDYEKFEEDISILVTAMDILIDAADYPTPEVEKITKETRPLGLGFSNLGALLMLKGLPYDSDTGRNFAEQITREMTRAAYVKSYELAVKLGPYKSFELASALVIADRLTDNRLIHDYISKTGLRNSQLTLLAPTGTISFLMDCDTTGIEPLYARKMIKTLAGGGTMEIAPDCIEQAVNNLNKDGAKVWDSDTAVDLVIPYLDEEQKKIFATANEISWKGHVDMMAACQPYLNGAISKTINLPADATVQDVFDVYMYGWKKGLKALAVYRDGSKGMQPLTTEKPIENEEDKSSNTTPVEDKENFVQTTRIKLPNTRKAVNHKFDIAGAEGYINVGMYDNGAPGEIFITMNKQGSLIRGILDVFSIVFSMSLQHGVPLEKIINKMIGTKFEPAGVTQSQDIMIAQSIMDYIGRWLELEFLNEKEDDEDDEDEEFEVTKLQIAAKDLGFDGPPCTKCGGATMRSGSCYCCTSCGETSGCS